jgi:NAD(P)-dependent dehydrogenase (short-subunit alcohol dehydrogenase family)
MSSTLVITGASSGIGRATAQLFHDKGWNVVATMRRPEDAGDLASLDNVLVTRLDVTDSASIEQAAAAAIERFGTVDVLVNNAGFGAYGPLEATSMETIRRQFDTNVVGLLETTKAFLPHFRANRSGAIVNVSSVGGKIAYPLGTLYHGTKFAVEGLSEALSYELAPLGIQVKIIEPGGVATDFAGRSFAFSHDPALADYQPIVDGLVAGFAGNLARGTASGVAEVIYTAATDGTAQLRYVYGDDAKKGIEARAALDDATFMAGIRSRFGL